MPDALHIAVTLACSSPRARDLLATAQGLRAWLAEEAEFVPNVGAAYRMKLPGGDEPQGHVQGFDPAAGVSYTFEHERVRRAFGVTVVRWSWEGISPDYSVVTLTHTGHGQGDAWQRAYEYHLALWTGALRNLASVVNEGKDLRRLPSRAS